MDLLAISSSAGGVRAVALLAVMTTLTGTTKQTLTGTVDPPTLGAALFVHPRALKPA